MLVRFFRSSFAGQYIAAGVFAAVLWAFVLPAPPPMPEPSGPVILYQLLYRLLSGYPLVASVAGFFVMLVSAFWVNLLFSKHELITKNSSFAAFLFIVLSCWHPSLMTLTPVNLSVLFFLSVIQSMLLAYNRPEPVDLTFSAGFMIMAASFIYIPSLFFYGFLLTTFLVYRTVKWREWMGSFIGLFTPLLFMAVYWFWTDRFVEVITEYGRYFSTFLFRNPWSDAGLWVPALFFLVLTLAGFSFNFSHLQEKTVETRKKMLLLIWLAVWTLITSLYAGPLLVCHSLLAVPAIVPFISNLYLTRKRTLWWELFLWAFILVIGVNLALNLIS